jgi:hypothetical protein
MTERRALLPLLAVLLGVSLLGNIYALSRFAGDTAGRSAFAELSTRTFEPEFRRDVKRELLAHAGEMRRAVADLRDARTRMFKLAASEKPDPVALAAATAEVRIAIDEAMTIYHASVVEAARKRAAPPDAAP